MKKNFYRLVNFLLSQLLVLFNIGCGPHADLYGPVPVALYGSPHADFQVSGTITEAGTQTPLQDIHVNLHHNGKDVFRTYDSDSLDADTLNMHPLTSSDSLGNYSIYFDGLMLTYDYDSVDVVVKDPAGVYEADSTRISTELNKKGDGDWYEGGSIHNGIDFQLVHKKHNKE